MMPHRAPAATPWSARLVDRLAGAMDRPARRHRRRPMPAAPTPSPVFASDLAARTARSSAITGGTDTATAVLERPTATVDAPGVEVVPEVAPPTYDDRRSFLFKAALVGTALAVGPGRFLLRPGTAYAAVCGSGAGCNEGWTAFCCTVNGGANTCPPGSYAAGWWKVDGSAFCGGSARYIIDCNRTPGASCTCRCASGTCDQRQVCCNNFRYGQCNLQIAGVTQVVCRVIVCTPPWVWDPACTTTSRTDNRTATHSAPCLPGPGASPVAIRYQDLGLVGSFLGRPTAGEVTTVEGGRAGYYERGVILFKPGLGARVIYDGIDTGYRRLGRERGLLGFPTTDERRVGDTRNGVYADFERGRMYAAPNLAAVELHGAILERYRILGGVKGALGLGYPITDEQPAAVGDGRISVFEGGAILWALRTGVAGAVFGDIWPAYVRLGRETGLGFPTGDVRPVGDGVGTFGSFENGRIYAKPGVGAFPVRGELMARYSQLGGVKGTTGLGYPVADERIGADGGLVTAFEGGAIAFRADLGAHGVHGPIAGRWAELGAETGSLGYPTTGVTDLGGGRQQVTFERGTLTYDPATDQVT